MAQAVRSLPKRPSCVIREREDGLAGNLVLGIAPPVADDAMVMVLKFHICNMMMMNMIIKDAIRLFTGTCSKISHEMLAAFKTYFIL